MDHDREVATVIDSEHVDIGQADQQLAHARRVELHRDSGTRGVGTTDSWSPCTPSRGPSPRHRTPLRSEAPRYLDFAVEEWSIDTPRT